MSKRCAFPLLPNHYHRHKHLPTISRVFRNCIMLDNTLGKALNLAVRVAWVWEECDQLHTHTALLLKKVIYTAMPEIAETSHGKHSEEVSVFDRISSPLCLVMSMHSISTNRYVTVVIIKRNSCKARIFWGILLRASVERCKINQFRPTWWWRICVIPPSHWFYWRNVGHL